LSPDTLLNLANQKVLIKENKIRAEDVKEKYLNDLNKN
jgi:hypothetical protein